MKNKSIKSKVVAGVLMASMMSSTTAVFAANNTSAFHNPQGGFNDGFNGRDNSRDSQNMFTTTRAQQGGNNDGDSQKMFTSALVQQDGNNDGDSQNMFTTKLADLVTAGTITSTQETAIETALAKQDDFNVGNNQNITTTAAVFVADTTNNAPTPQDDFGFNGRNNQNISTTTLDDLVTAGTITSTQETAIETALAQQGGSNVGNNQNITTTAAVFVADTTNNAPTSQDSFGFNVGNNQNISTTKLTDLVTSGTITSTQETAIEAALASAK